MWVTKLLISPVKKRIFCPKTTKFGPNLAFLVNLGQAMQGYSMPCWWVGWWLWRAGCISQDTCLLYDIHIHDSHMSTQMLVDLFIQIFEYSQEYQWIFTQRLNENSPRSAGKNGMREATWLGLKQTYEQRREQFTNNAVPTITFGLLIQELPIQEVKLICLSQSKTPGCHKELFSRRSRSDSGQSTWTRTTNPPLEYSSVY